MADKKRYAQVGLGARSEMYSNALLLDYSKTCQLVGLCDSNQGRLADRQTWAKKQGSSIPGYPADQFDRMLLETKPDCVIVTTIDCFHDDYICRAMEAGCDVITEKPMTTDETKCNRILQTQRKTGRECRVTFNYRYSPPRTQVKELLQSGIIGQVLSVDFHWMLDTFHGADYFRRWHSYKNLSGGLMVHKATHHFDLINWWLSTIPESVYAMGHRNFYTPKRADSFGLTRAGQRCLGCPETGRCAFRLDLKALQGLDHLYLKNEKYDGYIRDRCVFRSDIEIEDCVVATVGYKNGAKLSYSLNAFAAWEGYTVVFNGSRGRLEHKCEEQVYVSGDGTVPGALQTEGTWIKVFPLLSPAYEVKLWDAEGGHGGADPLMLVDIFQPDTARDKYLRAADQRAGAYSILCGIAANKSMATGQAVQISQLVPNLQEPDYPPMPDFEAPVALPESQRRTWLFS
jgi:predicted dehydrogenase